MKSSFRLFLGAAVAAATLWLTFRGLDLALVQDAVTSAHPWPIAFSLLIVAATVAASAERWRRLVFPRPALGGSYPRFFAAMLTAQMLNALLPIRLGEIGRACWISRSDQQPLGRVLATIVAERLTDLVMLGGSLLILIVMVVMPPWAEDSARLALGASAVILLTAIILSLSGPRLLAALERSRGWLPRRISQFVVRHGETALAEIAALAQWRRSADVWLWSAIIVVLAAATNYALFFAFDLPLSPAIALLLFVVLQIGGAPVATPGNLGVFHLLTVLVLTSFDVERAVAVAYAVVLHLVAVGSKILAGGVILAAVKTPMLERRSE